MLFEMNNDTGRRLYCGPGAISILTGTPASRVEQMLRRARNDWHRKQTVSAFNPKGKPYYEDYKRRQFKGTYHNEMVAVLERLGCKVKRFEPSADNHRTLLRFASDTEFMPQTFLISTGSHLVTVHRGQIADNWTGKAVTPAEYKRSKQQVKTVWTVEAPTTPKRADPIAPKRTKPKVQRDIKAERAKTIASQVAAWGGKLKRAQTALKKLRPKLRRYQKMGIIE